MAVIKRILFTLCISFAAVVSLTQFSNQGYPGPAGQFRTSGTSFQIYKDGTWQNFLFKGVNLGASKPGFFPGEMGITKDDYERWFRQIADMNANSIRVYTILKPAFYEALFEYNTTGGKPLYLFHGVWNNEDALARWKNAYQSEITDDFKSQIADLIDLLHGNKTIPPRPGHASGAYTRDLSPWVAGYILGIEQDAQLVMSTNAKNPGITGFSGDFLYTKDASPYECWLAQIGDYAIGYEYSKYKTQKPVSWTNWITTDPLSHPSDPDRDTEDAVSVDIEHILTKDSFQAGLFASYHVYPYYPEFMIFDPVLTRYIDAKGKVNPYEAYLRDLHAHYTRPLLVAEFGIPSSRGCTHVNELTGYNQGFVSEDNAGEYIADMFDSIAASGCAGGLIFSWQDEWSKRAWNTMDYDLPDRRAYWSNAQASEQSYGILSFDPGAEKSASYVDGDISEWAGVKQISARNGLALSAQSDEKYVYFMIRDSALNPEENKYAIAVSGLKGQGNYQFKKEGLAFKNPASQCIIISGKENS
ncbi:MAG: hypothetical protein FWC45_09490, partial [Treponema sp.]|nr:hypothetical protein [Treponema sp.]